MLGWALAVLPWAALAVRAAPRAPFAVDVAFVVSRSARSLGEHAEAVARPLREGRLGEARRRVGRMVSRETSQLDESGVAKAGMESVLENGNDAIFGALFWFALLGGPGALLLPAGEYAGCDVGLPQRTFQFVWLFCRARRRCAQLAAGAPDRSFHALLGARAALACWRAQAPGWGPNAGPRMGCRAGPGRNWRRRDLPRPGRNPPAAGNGSAPVVGDLARAILLIRRGLWLWLAVLSRSDFAMLEHGGKLRHRGALSNPAGRLA